jgi:hemerythrin-like domain-containing protein
MEGAAFMLMQIGQKPDSGFDEPIGVLEDCHKRILHFIRALSALAESAAFEPLGSTERDSLERSLRYFREAAPRHNADEEQSLFPLVRRHADAQSGDMFACLASLANDHRWAEQLHCEMDAIGSRWLAAGTLRPNDAGRFCSLTHSLSYFYANHIATEEGELFPAARRMLSPAESERLGKEMAARHGVVQILRSNVVRHNALATSTS